MDCTTRCCWKKRPGRFTPGAGENWFSDLLRSSYQNRRAAAAVGLEAEQFRPVQRPLLLNCLDAFYGHALLKLLNAQFYLDQRPDKDLVLLIPRYLRWLAPDGAAAIWQADLPLKRGAEWNDGLAAEIQKRVAEWPQCDLSVAFSHPHPDDFQIERFTRVVPFPLSEWKQRAQKPTVAFIWREDRLWTRPASPVRARRGLQKVLRRVGAAKSPRDEQQRQVIALAKILRDAWGDLDFTVVGLGEAGGLPDWMEDQRSRALDGNRERDWCRLYARSHVVVGVHGSNMLLPSAHAGATVEIVPNDRWGNLAQDILTPATDPREALCRCHFVPQDSPPGDAARIILSLIHELPSFLQNFCRPWNDHRWVQQDPFRVAAHEDPSG